MFRKVSAERVRDELLKLLAAPQPSRGLELMRTTGLLGEVIPELLEGVGCTQNRFHKHDVYEHTLHVVDETDGDAIRRLGALLHDVGKPRARQPREGAPGEFSFFQHEYVGAEMADEICRRLKLANADRERVVGIVKNHMFFYAPDWTDGTVRRFVRRVGGTDALADLFALRKGDVAGRGFDEDPEGELGELRKRIEAVAAEDAVLKVTDLAINGGDVMRVLRIPPSREVGMILERLLERVIDDPSLNEPAKLGALLPDVLAEIKALKKTSGTLSGSRNLAPRDRGHERFGRRDLFGAARRGLGAAEELGPPAHDCRFGIAQRQHLDGARVAGALGHRRQSARPCHHRQHRRQLDTQAALLPPPRTTTSTAAVPSAARATSSTPETQTKPRWRAVDAGTAPSPSSSERAPVSTRSAPSRLIPVASVWPTRWKSAPEKSSPVSRTARDAPAASARCSGPDSAIVPASNAVSESLR